MEISREIIDELKKETIELGNEYLDIGIGVFLEDTQLEKIPVVGTCTKVYKIAKDITSAFFYKKLTHFLVHMKNIDYSVRIKFLNRYIGDSNGNEQEMGEKILLTIDKIDELVKIKYYVNFIKMYALKDEVNYYIFMRLCYILENIFIGDLETFKNTNIDALKAGLICYDAVLTMSLSNLGLAMWDVRKSKISHTSDELRITRIGELFHEGLFWD